MTTARNVLAGKPDSPEPHGRRVHQPNLKFYLLAIQYANDAIYCPIFS